MQAPRDRKLSRGGQVARTPAAVLHLANVIAISIPNGHSYARVVIPTTTAGPQPADDLMAGVSHAN
jgi:hypothetical protein